MKMKALSIMQPWAFLIVRPDITDPAEREAARKAFLIKDLENRDWKDWNPGLKFRGKFLVHAGKNVDGGKRAYPDFRDDILQSHKILLPKFEELRTGGIVGMSEVLSVCDMSESPWFQGPKALVLGRSRSLPFMPLNGQLGFFDAEYNMELLNA